MLVAIFLLALPPLLFLQVQLRRLAKACQRRPQPLHAACVHEICLLWPPKPCCLLRRECCGVVPLAHAVARAPTSCLGAVQLLAMPASITKSCSCASVCRGLRNDVSTGVSAARTRGLSRDLAGDGHRRHRGQHGAARYRGQHSAGCVLNRGRARRRGWQSTVSRCNCCRRSSSALSCRVSVSVLRLGLQLGLPSRERRLGLLLGLPTGVRRRLGLLLGARQSLGTRVGLSSGAGTLLTDRPPSALSSVVGSASLQAELRRHGECSAEAEAGDGAASKLAVTAASSLRLPRTRSWSNHRRDMRAAAPAGETDVPSISSISQRSISSTSSTVLRMPPCSSAGARRWCIPPSAAPASSCPAVAGGPARGASEPVTRRNASALPERSSLRAVKLRARREES